MNENTHTTVEQLRERLDANNRNRIAAQKDLDNVCAATEKEIDDMRVKLQNELINVAKKDCEKIQDLIAKAEEGNLTQESCTSVLYTCHVYKVTSSTPRLLRLEVARVSRPHKKGTDLVAELQKAEAEQDDKRASAAEEIDEKCNKLIAEVRMLQYQVNHEVEVAYNAEDARLQALLSRITNSIGSDAVAALNAGKVGLVVWRKYFLVKNPSAEVVGDLCKLETTVSVWEFEKRMASNISISKIENGKIYLAFEGPFNSEELDVMKAHGVIKEEGSGNGNEAVMMVAALAEGDFSSDESVEQCFETFVIDPNGKTIIPGTLRAEAVYTLKVRAELNGMKGNWSTPVLFSTPAFSVCCVWRECPQKMDKNVRYELDPDNPRVAIRKSNYKQAIAVFGAVSFPVNKVISMAIKICCGGSNVVVGVMQSDVDQCYSTNLWIYEMFGWHFNCFDSTLCSGPPHCYWGKPYGPESCMITGVVGLVMDTVKGELSFYVNGVSYGVAYDGIPLDKPLIPSVVMSGYNNSVELKFIENIPNKVNSGIPVPLGLEGKRKGHDTIELWWEKNESIHFYQIETNGAKLLDATKSASFTKCMLLPGTDYKFRIRAVRDKDVSEWSDTVTVRTKEPRPFSKCKWRKYPGHDENGYVRSKLNHRLVKCVSYDTPCAVIGTAPLPLNKVVHWSIRVVNVYKEFGYGDKMCIGVAPMDINLLSSNVSMKCGWYIYCYSATLFSGPPQCYASKRYWAKTDPKDDESVGYYVRPDKSIVVTMDTTTGTLSFTKPYSDYGSEPAFEGIPLDKPLTPCVIFGHRGDELELVIPKTE